MVLDIKYYGEFNVESVKEIAMKGLLIMPTIAYANVDQMFIDILLYNAHLQNKLTKVAILNSSHVLPFLGSNPFSSKDDSAFPYTTALELFLIPESNVLILQQRSQPIDGMSSKFLEDMMSFIQTVTPNSIAFISSADCTYFDMQIMQNTIVYFTLSKEMLNKIGEEIPSMNLAEEVINGSGLLSNYQQACSIQTMKYSSFVAFVNEGRNFRDALEFFIKVNNACKWIDTEDVKMPAVWYEIDPWLDEDIM